MTRLLLHLVLALALGLGSGRAQTVTTLRTGTAPAKMMLVVLSEGYTSGEQSTANADAAAAADAFIDQPLWTNILTSTGLAAKEHWDAKHVFYTSAQSGLSYGGGATVITRYSAQQNFAGGGSQLIGAASTLQARSDANAVTTSNRLILVVCNTTSYCGGGGAVVFVSKHASAAEIGRHEAGHTFAGLGDEYETAYPGFPDVEEPNTTRTISPLKWASIVNTYFEGAHYHSTGWYRPEADCKMRTLGQPFCAVCRHYMLATLSDATQPAAPVLAAPRYLRIRTTP